MRRRLAGRRILAVRVLRGDILQPSAAAWRREVPGRTLQEVSRAGKCLVWHLGPDLRALWSLRMTGQPRLAHPESPLAPHTHLVFAFEGMDEEFRYRDVRRFGRLRLYRPGEEASIPLLGGAGPDALTIGQRAFREALAGRSAPVKSVLLDQRRLAGVGNIYADEALHRAGIHPATAAGSLAAEAAERLRTAIQDVLAEGIRRGGSTIESFGGLGGESGGYQKLHRVYGRGGEPCLTCGARIARLVLGGRSSHYCPACQGPRPRRRAVSRRARRAGRSRPHRATGRT